MIRKGAIVITFLSVILFPWPLTACLALALSPFEPLVPLAIGIFADALYYSHPGSLLPLASLAGAIATALALFVRSTVKARIIEG